ncbi:TrmH family RNA methyltransferase [Tepidimonas charontis]|uniref:23S rRNA (Adenosine(1067)-2'-O)-methyltransferase n=1 Tax=Tepidimonas charontis TaxID=2267262 RepID=A0A554X9U4_9BURK|nr:RNA methyltransferase [Tepidimonas charontis]TSE32625.1 23S rRNA (adenosine(1067)-2'-O)-methyltransferase [Tepidimonas charontis]
MRHTHNEQAPPIPLTSRDNPRIKQLRRLAQAGGVDRRAGLMWVEGDHLCAALLARAGVPVALVSTPAGLAWVETWRRQNGLDPAVPVWTVTPALMRHISALESPAPIACLARVPAQPTWQGDAPAVVLDRLQDPGNVGSILRSASAFGVRQIVALRGTVALWSSKVLRAGMGAHFHLHILEGCEPGDLHALRVPLLATSSHHGQWLHEADLPWPCAWLFGHEGQGVQAALQAQAALTVRIAQPGGEESLNVAAAAAICLHASVEAR